MNPPNAYPSLEAARPVPSPDFHQVSPGSCTIPQPPAQSKVNVAWVCPGREERPTGARPTPNRCNVRLGRRHPAPFSPRALAVRTPSARRETRRGKGAGSAAKLGGEPEGPHPGFPPPPPRTSPPPTPPPLPRLLRTPYLRAAPKSTRGIGAALRARHVLGGAGGVAPRKATGRVAAVEPLAEAAYRRPKPTALSVAEQKSLSLCAARRPHCAGATTCRTALWDTKPVRDYKIQWAARVRRRHALLRRISGSFSF